MKNTVSVSKQERRNLIAFPIATVGRDMCSQFFSLSVLNFILFTKNLTVEQFSAKRPRRVSRRQRPPASP